MRAVLVLFEGVATGAADGYARMAEKPAASLLHLGPGLANGLANLHNAKKARSPVVNIIGDHATYHQLLEAPLTSDVKAFAAPVSQWIKSSPNGAEVGHDAAAAVRAANSNGGQIASLILPADTAGRRHMIMVSIASPKARNCARRRHRKSFGPARQQQKNVHSYDGPGVARTRPRGGKPHCGKIRRANFCRYIQCAHRTRRWVLWN